MIITSKTNVQLVYDYGLKCAKIHYLVHINRNGTDQMAASC